VVRPRRRVVLQARTSSTRLPGKVLLPICGMPIVVLAAKRAARDGLEVVVATSDDASDDELAATIKQHGLICLRGPLDDVLSRFVLSTGDLADDDICVRFTSDNVFPDSDFANRVADAAEKSAGGYAGFSGGTDGLPYGLAGEAFRVGLLREAQKNATTTHEREHVSPWIVQQAGRVIAPMPGDPMRDMSGLRCTIDTLEDYRNVSAALAGFSDPIGAPWIALCHRLADRAAKMGLQVPARIVAGTLQASLVLGGVQFGLPYGIANRTGRPDDGELRRILELAENSGVSHLDTAAGYGESEERIGAVLDANSPLALITKLPPDASGPEDVRRSMARSLQRLRRGRLDAVLLHRFEHFHAADGAIWEALSNEQKAGRVDRIGVSIYHPDQLRKLLQEASVNLIQLPFSILDRRWLAPDLQSAIAARPDVILHGRSALLQGLLSLSDPTQWPWDPSLAKRCIVALEDLTTSLGRRSVIDLCFAYARAQTWLAGIVVGAETVAQMAENIELFRTSVLTADQVALVAQQIPSDVPESLLDPSQWPRTA
jgi:spore coat polysaccharide biosynthesis protein SpsF (cytidylyltransferase family)/aryl-alcohol dehydrogenase-like predicted oxidoreductase